MNNTAKSSQDTFQAGGLIMNFLGACAAPDKRRCPSSSVISKLKNREFKWAFLRSHNRLPRRLGIAANLPGPIIL